MASNALALAQWLPDVESLTPNSGDVVEVTAVPVNHTPNTQFAPNAKGGGGGAAALTPATATTLGGVMIGVPTTGQFVSGVDGTGKFVWASPPSGASYTLPVSTAAALGGVYATPNPGGAKGFVTGVDTSGNLTFAQETVYTLPVAGANLGGVKVGATSPGSYCSGVGLDGALQWTALPAAPPGAMLTDGDKSDISVSSSGTVWVIDNGAVTYAKMQNVAGAQRVLGSARAGASPSELTASEILDWVFGVAAQGAVLFRGATKWQMLAPGNSGEFLQTGGAGSDPHWARATPSGGGSAVNAMTWGGASFELTWGA